MTLDLLRPVYSLNKIRPSPHHCIGPCASDLRVARSVGPAVCTSATCLMGTHLYCRHMMKLPSRDSASSQVCPKIYVLTLFWQLQWSSGLLWGAAVGTHSCKDWGTSNGVKITGRVWTKTAFKPLTFLFPWLLLIRNESSSAGRRWDY